jgi:transcriptional regulator with XRE-family HTH domain
MEATTPRIHAYGIGARIAEVRRNRGMTQRDLGQALGVSTWKIDRLERGVDDPRHFASAIAEVTAARPEWLTGAAGDTGVPSRERSAGLPHLGLVGRDLVLAAIVLLVTIRFFTEVVPLLPRAANFIDIPIFLAISFAAMNVSAFRGSAYLAVGTPALVFGILAIVSAVLNAERTEAAPAVVFVYGFLAPMAVYAAVYRIWPPGSARALSQVLVGLGVLQLAVVALIDLPRFVASGGDPDYITGTFGTNAYQLVFFLLVVAALLAGIFALEPKRRIARLAPLLILAIFAVILLAQYRALLATTVVTVVAVGLLLSRRLRGLSAAALALVALGVAFSYVASSYPGLGLKTTATTLTSDPSMYVKERYRATRPLRSLYDDHPTAIAYGSGPGTFSSRAFQTFANAASTSASNVQGGYAQRLTSGVYETDVSTHYVRPQLTRSPVIEGSHALSSPYSSYLSLAAEVGIAGLALIAGVYLIVLLRSLRLAKRAIARATPGDPLPALVLATAIGFLALLQMGFLENWFEVTRVTFIAWAILGVVMKELDDRSALDS